MTCLYCVKGECKMKTHCKHQDPEDGSVCTVKGEIEHDGLTKAVDRTYWIANETQARRIAQWE